MTNEELEQRVRTYFDTGKPKEPAGRLILDLMARVRGLQKALDECRRLAGIGVAP